MLIFTDAGYKKGISSHGFIVKSWNDKIITRESFSSNEEDSLKSEMASIVSALYWLDKRIDGFKVQPRIYTDSKIIHEAVYDLKIHGVDVNFIKYMLKRLDVKLYWRKRRHVKQAHKLAKTEMKASLNSVEYEKEKIKYKCEGSQRFKVGNKKKNKYKNK